MMMTIATCFLCIHKLLYINVINTYEMLKILAIKLHIMPLFNIDEKNKCLIVKPTQEEDIIQK